MPTPERLFAEFDGAGAVLAVIPSLREAGAEVLDVYSPYPVYDIERALGIRRSRIPYACFAFAMLGAGAAYFLQWWMNAFDYPLDVGGRPLHMPAAFFPVTFEMGVLACALAGFVAVLVVSGLPALWRPEFEVSGFESVSADKFWMALDCEDAEVAARASETLRRAGALQVVGRT